MAGARHWEITVYKSSEILFRRLVPVSEMSERQLENCMRALVSKHLTEDEIVSSHLNGRWGSKKRASHMEIVKSNDDQLRRTDRVCGSNPHVVALLVPGIS
jgi:hypothetical protein